MRPVADNVTRIWSVCFCIDARGESQGPCDLNAVQETRADLGGFPHRISVNLGWLDQQVKIKKTNTSNTSKNY